MRTRSRPLTGTLFVVVLLAGGLLLHSRDDGGHVPALWVGRTSEEGVAGLDRSDGYLGGREVSVRSSEPAVTRLDASLRAALVSATDDAERDGVTLRVNSGWRSAAYQQVLLDEAEKRYGDAAEAGRWVRTPESSTHVSGDAVDVGPASSSSWLARHGARYDLCRTYANEPWHFELRATPHGRCPALRPDSSS
jgi:D-alanyl-D-alanine carboxypeptidase